MLIDALSILCGQLTRDLLAIAKFLFRTTAIIVSRAVQNVLLIFCSVRIVGRIVYFLFDRTVRAGQIRVVT